MHLHPLFITQQSVATREAARIQPEGCVHIAQALTLTRVFNIFTFFMLRVPTVGIYERLSGLVIEKRYYRRV